MRRSLRRWVCRAAARGLVIFAHGSGSSRFSSRNRAVHGTIPRYAGDFETAAFDDNKLWLRHTDAREYRAAGLPNFTGTCIMQIDLQSGSVEREIPVQVPQEYIASQKIAYGWLTNIGLSALRVTFAEAAAGVVLDVSVVSYQREKDREYESLQIPLRDFLRTIS